MQVSRWAVAAHGRLIQSSQHDMKLTYKAIIRNRALYHLHFKAVIKRMGFLFFCLVFVGEIFYFVFFFLCFCFLFCFWFSITWNIWKLFNLNVGGKQVRHYFCTKLAFLIVQMNLVPPKMVRGHILTRLI